MKNKVQGYLQDREYEYFKKFCDDRGLSVSSGLNVIISEHMDIDRYKAELKQHNYNSNMYKEILSIKEILNTYLHASNELDAVFVPTSVVKHPMLEKAENEVGKRMAEKKQRKDSKRK